MWLGRLAIQVAQNREFEPTGSTNATAKNDPYPGDENTTAEL
jgi:hypothetical protein